MNQCNKRCRWLFPLLLALVLLASFLSPAFHASLVSASTEVGGQITSNTTWTKANSPYIVTSSVLVNQGVTLTIEPGVTVKCDSAKAIRVDGQLIARGTEAEPITFTANQPSPAPGDWLNILFTDSSVDATYNSEDNYTGGSIMQYCTVKYGGSTGTPAIEMISASPLIDHCTITNNANVGIYIYGGSPKISHNTISNNTAPSYREQGGGIYAHGTVTIVTISDNIISNNTAGDGGGIYACGTVTINGNTISNNTAGSGGGIYTDGTVTINDNTISNNTAYPGDGGGIYAHGTVTISNNTISNNTASRDGGGICNHGTVTISGNTISNNTASRDGGGICAYYIVSISHNTICNNLAGSGIGCFGQVTANYNNIYDNAPYDLAQGTLINARNNWWGTTNETIIQAHIYDWYDDATLGIVDYVPFLTSEVDITAPSTPLVTDDGATTNNNAQLHAVWIASDPESSIAEYQYAIGTSAGGTDVVGWTSTGTATEVTHTGLSLTTGTKYYISVKAKSGSGVWSDVGVSHGITVVPEAKTTSEGLAIWVWIVIGIGATLGVGILAYLARRRLVR